MASRVILSHAKFLGYVAFNELNFVRSSVSFGCRCVRNASYVNFSKKWTRNNDSREITASTSLVQNGVRSFSLQHWHGELGTHNDSFKHSHKEKKKQSKKLARGLNQ